MLDQTATPLLDTLKTCAQRPHAPFYAPGHKQGKGISQQLSTWLGLEVFQADLPELPDLDNLFAPESVIKEAQKLAAAAFGAEDTYFLINGSSCGIIAAILATCDTGDKIILPRNSHQSAIAGLILSGAIPIFINPEYDSSNDFAHSITAAALAETLKDHPDAKAVMMVYPTYHGVCGDINAIASLVHQYNLPLLVDEAHGPHFTFHPNLPPSALSTGADLTVQSTHKVLGAMTQASMLHIQGNRINTERLKKALQLLQSTSPNYLLLASLDAARQQMALYGNQLMTRTLALAKEARNKISQIPGLSVLESANTPGFFTLDPTRLTVKVSELGLSGFEVDEIFHQQLGVIAELPTLQHLTFIISLGNTEADIQQLIQAFSKIAQEYSLPQVRGETERFSSPLPIPHTPHPTPHTPVRAKHLDSQILVKQQSLSPKCFAPTDSPLQSPHSRSDFGELSRTADAHGGSPLSTPHSPREAFFAPTETLPIEQTPGKISAEIVCPYPPGIPALMPGERIEQDTIEYLEKVQSLGGNITGCSDRTLKTLKVVSC